MKNKAVSRLLLAFLVLIGTSTCVIINSTVEVTKAAKFEVNKDGDSINIVVDTLGQ